MGQTKASKLPVLRSESAVDYLALRARLSRDINPNGAIEEIYLEEIATLVWEIQRLRQYKVSTLHQAFSQALRKLVEQLLAETSIFGVGADQAFDLAEGWFNQDAAAKKEIRDLLDRFDLDETAIEAEAMRLAVDQLHYLDRSLAMASVRLDKAYRLIMEFRAGFGQRLRQQSDKILHPLPAPQQTLPAIKGSGPDAEKRTAA